MTIIRIIGFDPLVLGNAAQWLSAIATIITVFFALRSASGSKKAAMRAEEAVNALRALVDKITPGMKQISTATMVSHYNNRYERLVYEHTGEIDAERFFTQFWNLQYEQFLSFKGGLIPDDDYRYWQRERVRDFRNSASFRMGAIDFAQGWQSAKNRLALTADFRDLVDRLSTDDLAGAMAIALAARENRDREMVASPVVLAAPNAQSSNLK